MANEGINSRITELVDKLIEKLNELKDYKVTRKIRKATGADLNILDSDYTVIYSGATAGSEIRIPKASSSNRGRIIIVITDTLTTTDTLWGYYALGDGAFSNITLGFRKQLKVQSDGSDWYEIP